MRFSFTKHGFRCALLCFVLLFTGCQPTSLPCDSELNSQYDWENDLVIIGDAIPSLIAAIEAHDQGVEDILNVRKGKRLAKETDPRRLTRLF